MEKCGIIHFKQITRKVDLWLKSVQTVNYQKEVGQLALPYPSVTINYLQSKSIITKIEILALCTLRFTCTAIREKTLIHHCRYSIEGFKKVSFYLLIDMYLSKAKVG